MIYPEITDKAFELVKIERERYESTSSLKRPEERMRLRIHKCLGKCCKASLERMTIEHQIELMTLAAANAVLWLEKIIEMTVSVDTHSHTDDAFRAVKAEREKQDGKWGLQRHEDGTWMLILEEEIGEVAEILLGPAPLEPELSTRLFEESVQVVAVIVAWLEQLVDYKMVYDGTRVYPDQP